MFSTPLEFVRATQKLYRTSYFFFFKEKLKAYLWAIKLLKWGNELGIDHADYENSFFAQKKQPIKIFQDRKQWMKTFVRVLQEFSASQQ